MSNPSQQVKNYLLDLQDRICQTLAQAEGRQHFCEENWHHHTGGGGRSRVMEKGAVSFSYIQGESLPPSATTAKPELAGCKLEVMGVSLVIHPLNPYILEYLLIIARRNTQSWRKHQRDFQCYR